jgi:DNA-binding winged helix-turn-helix (wHTH) protein/Tol biopolymer transport system component
VKPLPEVYGFGPFYLNRSTRELLRGNELVALTPKAFDTLAVLIACRERVLEKAELLQEVWPDVVVAEETLTQNIATLRKALGDNPDRPEYITTVPRHGYRFIAPVQIVDWDHRNPEKRIGTIDPAPRRPMVTAMAVPVAAAAGIAIGLLVAWAVSHRTPMPSSSTGVIRLVVPPPEGTSLIASASFPAVSPNGQLVAFLAARPGEPTRLWVRSLDALTARELVGTDGALGPFWSSDSRSLAFIAHKQLEVVTLLGEPPRVLCDWDQGAGVPGGTWNRDDVILFSHRNLISQVPARGGTPKPITALDMGRGEYVHQLPQFLPDGKHFLYIAKSALGVSGSNWIVVANLDGSERRRLMEASSQATYAPPGYVVLVRDGRLLAQPFNAERREVTGMAVPIPDAAPIGVNPGTPRGMFSVSQSGTLAYRLAATPELGWFDRAGMPLGWVSGTGRDFDPALSPDGKRLAVSRYDASTGTYNIWQMTMPFGGQASMLTRHLSWARCPAWSADGTRIAFASGEPDDAPLYEQPVTPNADAAILLSKPAGCPIGWTHDGRALMYVGRARNADASTVAYLSGGLPVLLPGTWARRAWPRVAPDGRWIAFVSERPGRQEVYLQAFPSGTADAVQVSSRGGIEPQWRADGRELYFIALDKQLMAVPITTEPRLRVGMPVPLFRTAVDTSGVGITGRNQYVAAADGARFLIKQPRADGPPPAITVVVNWQRELEAANTITAKAR